MVDWLAPANIDVYNSLTASAGLGPRPAPDKTMVALAEALLRAADGGDHRVAAWVASAALPWAEGLAEEKNRRDYDEPLKIIAESRRNNPPPKPKPVAMPNVALTAPKTLPKPKPQPRLGPALQPRLFPSLPPGVRRLNPQVPSSLPDYSRRR